MFVIFQNYYSLRKFNYDFLMILVDFSLYKDPDPQHWNKSTYFKEFDVCNALLKPFLDSKYEHFPQRSLSIIHLSISPLVHQSTCPSVRLSISPTVHRSACPSVRLSISPPAHQSSCLLVRLSISKPVFLIYF